MSELLEDPANQLLVSYAAVWEMLNKIGRGGLIAAEDSVPKAFGRIQDLGVTFLPVTINHILSAASLTDIHRDPYDRMYIAQALAEGVPLVTVDPDIWKYSVETIWK